MASPRVLILRAPGINCDEETAYAWKSVGANPDRVHINHLCENPALLGGFQVLTIPGGFSYGDDIASGRILANQITNHLPDELAAFIDRGGLVVGICNGFQVLVRMGIVPGADIGVRVTLALNESGRYEDRWVSLRAQTDRCAFLEKGQIYRLPVAHGEGRVVVAGGSEGAKALASNDRIALRYAADDALPAGSASNRQPSQAGECEGLTFPSNPNGSTDNIAGLIDSTGRVFGLMPHPERCIFATHVPAGIGGRNTDMGDQSEPDGLRMFRTAVKRLSS
ncbi:MAG: phosphoribosylformylglycinamidine synthase subunit PurQ [Phycisphaerae bacterium]|nr:phosphoribosylformylglycinamidine synthase subunit PurQ [Phycisphaerae bacterium]